MTPIDPVEIIGRHQKHRRGFTYDPRMPETPEEIYARASGGLRMPAYSTWSTWPFEGELGIKELRPPIAAEPKRHGEGGIDCRACTQPDEDFSWASENWRIKAGEPSGLPLVMFLYTRAHHADPGDLPDDLAAEFGVMTARLERAMRSIGDIGRVHISRWGDGGEHLHWWFLRAPRAVPAAAGNLRGVLGRHPAAHPRRRLARERRSRRRHPQRLALLSHDERPVHPAAALGARSRPVGRLKTGIREAAMALDSRA